MNITKLMLAVAITVATVGCHKSAETERKEAVEAAERAQEKSAKAHNEAVDERNDYLAAIRREQIDFP
jgi:hypothetical protein